MKVSLSWLDELINLDCTPTELADKLSLTSIGVKDLTKDYLELDLTYNRGDLLSLRGVAREISAITNSKIIFDDRPFPKYDLPETPVKIEDEKLASLQCVAKIEGLKFGVSSAEWIKKLNDSGMRTVNNIADVTNLIMLEYGQPLHSFDADTVKNGLIEVRRAIDGEEIKTLDNKLRKLTTEDIVLADTEKPLDVAGVMGGKDTEIKESTTTILLSASMFNPSMVRKTSKRLGLYSEASKRFQHGLTKTNLLQAFHAAIKMYEAMGGKLTAVNLVGNLKDENKTIKLSQEKVNSLIGVNISDEDIESSLKSLGFLWNNWEVTVPYWRLDINIEEDLIEEVARMFGYDKIENKALGNEKVAPTDQSLYAFIYNLKVALKEAGVTESYTYSFFSSTVLTNLNWDKNNLVKIANPISTETEYMRDKLWPNLLEVIAKNIRQGYKDIAVFEIGKVYIQQKGNLPEENYHLSIALCNGTENPINELSVIARSVETWQSSSENNPTKIASLIARNDDSITKSFFHPTRHTDSLAEVHPRIVNKFGIEQRIAVLEIELKEIL